MSSVLVTNALDRAALAVVRDLGRGGHTVFGAAERAPPLGLRSRYCRAHLVMPAGRPAAELAERAAAAGVEVLLPMGTPDVLRLARARPLLARRFALTFPSEAAVRHAYDKRRTHDLCRRLGVAVARLVEDADPAGAVVVKPRHDLGGARGVRYFADAAAARRAAGPDDLLCEYVPGPSTAMRAATLLFDRRSRLVAWFTLRKIRQYPAKGGLAALVESSHEPALVEAVLPFFEHLGWQGPAEVEFKIDARCGTPRVIEINPRLPGYVRYFLDCGLHLPRLLVEAACGRVASPTGYVVGRRMLNPGVYLKLCRQLLAEEGPAACLRAAREAAGARWRHPADITDPAPRLAKFLMRPAAPTANDRPS